MYACTVFVNAGLPDCPASGQSGTGTKKNAGVGTSPVPEIADPVRCQNATVTVADWDVGCRNADAGGISLDVMLFKRTHRRQSKNLSVL